ncbi:MAG: tRNA dihydrouridine(20/20a) synthase DusA [Gammaproteobacteria bacterium]|nr:tRNA dihydrouridine(20/20a) synthase DusA [Gammaproteobacteria bacterium]
MINNTILNNPISIAPMLRLTNRHCRYLHRLLTRHALLYTEMVTTGAILHNDPERFLAYNDIEHPVALQLGGADPKALAACAKIAADFGYDEINLNVGCPSSKVQAGKFGACLMLEPELVAECVAEMQAQVEIPVTVKMRLGVDEHDSYAELQRFIELVARGGCRKFIIHARKCYLKKSPKENRKLPELNYSMVYDLKRDFPELAFILNGEIDEDDQIETILQNVEGVMLGRKAYTDPYFLAAIDKKFYGAATIPRTREELLALYKDYMAIQQAQGVGVAQLIRPLQGLFRGQPNAKEWRLKTQEAA